MAHPPLLGRTGLFFLVLAAIGFGVFVWLQLGQATLPERSIPESGLQQLQATTLPDVGGNPVPVAGWRGKILVVNFWATWCPPCRKEMPAFSRLHDKLSGRGVQFVGIGIDSPSAIKEFALQMPVSYPLLIGGTAGLELTRVLGNEAAALPYTLVLDRDGRPVFSRLGMIEESQLEALLTPLLAGT